MRKAAIVLAVALLTGGVVAADSPKDSKPGRPITALGVLTDNKVAMIWVDGEDAPTKFALAEGFDKNTFGFPPKGKGVFVPDRVLFESAPDESVSLGNSFDRNIRRAGSLHVMDSMHFRSTVRASSPEIASSLSVTIAA
ncbi:MAG: hypothetical protein WCJ35_06345 [Planctomycetota bacterium]